MRPDRGVSVITTPEKLRSAIDWLPGTPLIAERCVGCRKRSGGRGLCLTYKKRSRGRRHPGRARHLKAIAMRLGREKRNRAACGPPPWMGVSSASPGSDRHGSVFGVLQGPVMHLLRAAGGQSPRSLTVGLVGTIGGFRLQRARALGPLWDPGRTCHLDPITHASCCRTAGIEASSGPFGTDFWSGRTALCAVLASYRHRLCRRARTLSGRWNRGRDVPPCQCWERPGYRRSQCCRAHERRCCLKCSCLSSLSDEETWGLPLRAARLRIPRYADGRQSRMLVHGAQLLGPWRPLGIQYISALRRPASAFVVHRDNPPTP